MLDGHWNNKRYIYSLMAMEASWVALVLAMGLGKCCARSWKETLSLAPCPSHAGLGGEPVGPGLLWTEYMWHHSVASQWAGLGRGCEQRGQGCSEQQLSTDDSFLVSYLFKNRSGIVGRAGPGHDGAAWLGGVGSPCCSQGREAGVPLQMTPRALVSQAPAAGACMRAGTSSSPTRVW